MMDLQMLALLGIVSFAAAAFPDQAKEAEEGDDVFLECQADHEVDVSTSPVTWSKDDARNIVHVYIRGQDRAYDQKAAFKNRTVLFHKGLRKGNVTLQLSTVRLSDSGKFMCHIIRPETYCYTVLRVVKKGQLVRSLESVSNITTPRLKDVPKPDDSDGESGGVVCAGVMYTVVPIFCGVLVALILMILGTVWIYKKIQTRRRAAGAGRRTNNTEMQNLRGEGREGGEHLANATDNIQQQV